MCQCSLTYNHSDIAGRCPSRAAMNSESSGRRSISSWRRNGEVVEMVVSVPLCDWRDTALLVVSLYSAPRALRHRTDIDFLFLRVLRPLFRSWRRRARISAIARTLVVVFSFHWPSLQFMATLASHSRWRRVFWRRSDGMCQRTDYFRELCHLYTNSLLPGTHAQNYFPTVEVVDLTRSLVFIRLPYSQVRED